MKERSRQSSILVLRIIVLLVIIASFVYLFSCSAKKNRIVESFNAGWKFILADSLADYSAQTIDDAAWRKLDLPHDWSIESDFSIDNPASPGCGALPGGIGWYRKTFSVMRSNANKKIYIDFDGIYWNSEVWINGHSVGKRPNGYVSFRYDLTPYIKYGEKNTIAVRVDNSQQPNSRWYTGSGIYRNVRLTYAHPLHVGLWGTYVTTPKVTDKQATLAIQTQIEGKTQYAPFVLYHSLVDDNDNMVAKVCIDSDDKTAILSVDNPRLWSLEDPHLYKLITEVVYKNKVVDEYETTVGIRSFNFDPDKGFILNGKPVKINGVCNHHDLGCLGTAVNVRALQRQLEILKEMGCNGIRCTHNPPAPELLELCDRMGFIVQDEAFDVWRKKKSQYDYSQYFLEWHERDLTDLVLRDRNHPSIFSWSIGNEVLEQWTNADTDDLSLQEANFLLNKKKDAAASDPQTEEANFNVLLTQRLADLVRSLDPTRPISAGCNESKPNNHLFRSGAIDIIGYNYQTGDYATVKENYPGKPFLATETVSGLMTRGYYIMPSDSVNVWPSHWSQSFQRDPQQCSAYDNCRVPWGNTHEESLKLMKKYPNCAGQYIWTGFDYLGEPTPYWWPSRSSYFGIIDLCGFPKDVYYLYQSEWTDKDVLHVFPHWNWNPGQVVDVWAYYNNADEVELFLNGESLGKKSKEGDKLHVSWRVPFEAGTLKAISYKAGKKVLEREIKTAGKPARIRLTPDRKELSPDKYDLSYVTVEVLDNEGNVVPTADNFIQFSISDNATIAGTDNGDPTDHQSLSKPERRLFNGKALVVVRAGDFSGRVRLIASSDGLYAGACEIRLEK